VTTWTVHIGDARRVLSDLPEASVDAIVTSPPYFAQRDYGEDGQLGREGDQYTYVERLCQVFNEAARVLKPSGAMWLNLGDSYCSAKGQSGGHDPKQPARRHGLRVTDQRLTNLKPKDLIGIPWMVAFALRDRGWWLRADQIWFKPNGMVGSQRDRPTLSHEHVFLLTRSRRYYFDADAIREPLSETMRQQMERTYTRQARKRYPDGVQNASDVKRRILAGRDKQRGHSRRHAGFNARWDQMTKAEQMAHGSMPRSVWRISPTDGENAHLDHFALMPRRLARKLVVSSCPPGGVVLDPFCGCGTTGVVALQTGRSFVGIELSPRYRDLAVNRLARVTPLLAHEVPA
jgi:DNA modification methylase